MSICPSCQSPVAPKVRFCPACGNSLVPQTAPSSPPVGHTTAPLPATEPIGSAPLVEEPLSSSVSTAENSTPPSPRPSSLPLESLESTAPPKSTPTGSPAPPRATSSAFAPDPDAEVSLRIRFPYALVAGHSSLATVQIHNHTDQAILNGEITLEARCLAQLCLDTFRQISAGASKEFNVEVEPARAGPGIIQVGLLVNDHSGRRAYRGKCSQAVYSAPENGNINISIGDIQKNTGGGANAGLGSEFGEVQISNLLGDHKFTTLNDLLTTEIDSDFELIDLDLDYGLSSVAVAADNRSRSLSIPREYLGFAQASRRCVLAPTQAGLATLTLTAAEICQIGRNRQKVEFPAWWWPRSAAHDEKTRRISQLQVCIAVEGDGLIVWDPDSANGNLCDGQVLPPGERAEGTVFKRRISLALAHEYGLDVEHIPGSAPHGPTIRGIERWSGPSATPSPQVTGSVNFTPTSCAPSPFNAIWLLSDAAFGSSAANPLTLAEAGLAEVQGRFHWYRDCFWLESIAANNALRVNGRSLYPGEIAPIVNGMLLGLGSQEFRADI